jgi:hypothetical protein
MVEIARIDVFLKRSERKNLSLAIWLRALNSALYLATAVWRVVNGEEITINMESKELNPANSDAESLWAINN